MDCAFRKGEIISLGSDAFVIEDIIGRGASSIVYRANHQKLHTEHLLKEYNPQGIEIYRNSSKELHVKDKSKQQQFDEGLARFTAGYELQKNLRKNSALTNSISNVQRFFDEYGTKYIEMPVVYGKTYDQVTEHTLKDLLLHIKAITKTISCFHSEGYLLLDVKPENIFITPENTIMLFDFDSVVFRSDLVNTDDWYPMSTRGWFAPELKDKDCKLYIDEKTDIYSIGMILYYKLTGEPLKSRTTSPKKLAISLDPTIGLLKDIGSSVLDPLIQILSHTLCTFSYRWHTEQLMSELEKIINELNRLEAASCETEQPASSVPNQDQVNVDQVEKQLSKLHRTIFAAAILICIPIFLLFFGSLLSDLKAPASSKPDTTQMEQLQQPEPTDVVVESTDNMQAETSPATITEAPTTMPMQEIEESAVPSMPDNENGKVYAIDTIAYTSENFRSLIVTNDGTVIYLDGSTIVNVNNSISADMKTDFGEPLENGYLAYDPYNDIVYLLTGGSLTIYNITNLSNPVLVADDFSIRLAYDSDIAEQIAVLPDGSLLVPADLDGTYRIDLAHKQAVSFTHLYKMQPPAFRKVIGNSIVEMYAEDTKAVVMPLTGGQEYRITLETEAPHDEARCANTIMDEIWFYRSGIGVCSINQDGKYSVVIDQKEIQINDYQTLDYTNIWAFATNSNGVVAFYDNSLKCIRCIKAAESNRLG